MLPSFINMELVLLTRNVKKIKDAAHKNDDIDGTWKQALTRVVSIKGVVSVTQRIQK